MKDDVYTNVKPTLCDVCGMVHRTYEDGFSYLDCMIYYRNNIESKEVKEARESKVEIWDNVNKIWVRKCKDDLVVYKSK